MSNDLTMQELELETAELLPSRETLWSSRCGCHGHGGVTTVVAGNGDNDGNGLISVLSGDLDGNTIIL
jgi:hypothetical protein